MQAKSVCVMGLGYIGLPTAALLANRQYQVHGVDVVQSTVDTINQGKIHIVEPDLDTFVRSAVNSGNLVADTEPKASDVFIIAVPTPFHEGYVPNIDYVVSATEAIAPYIEAGNIVILESTSPVGTTEKIAEVLERNELSILAEKFGIDVWELIALANRHPRVNILQPGAGVGGHCIAVDPWFIVHAGGEDAKIIRAKSKQVRRV